MNLCRLCGDEKSPLDFNVELSDKTASNWTYRELIEFHSRVSLKTNKLLPQNVCEDCRAHVEGFSDFSQKLQEVQNSLDSDDEPMVQFFPETIIKSEDENESAEAKGRPEEALSFEEIFSKELAASPEKILELHLNVPESAMLSEGETTDEFTQHIDQTRWSDMAKSCGFSNINEFNAHQESGQNVKFACALCSNSFKKVYAYINHVLNKHLHLEHLRYCCLICDMMFFNLVVLHCHVKNYHPTEKIFQCLVCGNHSESLASLKKHKKIHDFEKENKEIVKFYESVETSKTSNLAIEVRYKNEDGSVAIDQDDRFRKWSTFKIKCALCSKVDLSPIDYLLHHQNDHTDLVALGKCSQSFKFTCYDCLESFASLSTFCSHQVYKHNHEELSYRCIVCSKLFWNYLAYSKHLMLFHPSFKHFLCMICGKLLDRMSNFRHHLTAAHGTGEIEDKKRRKEQREEKSKRSKFSTETESDLSTDYSESSHEDDSEDDAAPNLRVEKRSKKPKKIETPKRRPNNRHRPEKQNLFGPDLDTPEKLFADEIYKTSIFKLNLHLNISAQANLPNGEVTEELANDQGLNPLRWKDLLVCAVCKVKFSEINSLTDHIAESHGTRTRAFGCFNCDTEYGALYESSLVNHLAERHYHEHLKLCCLICSKLFYDFLSLVKHYKTHDGRFEILVCFICGFYAKTLDDLKEHKAYHIQMESTKPDNQKLCERVLEKFNKGNETNTINMEVAEYERNPDGTVTIECQRRFTIDWSFAQYQCPLCLIDLSNPFELFAHLRLKHPKEQEHARKIYSCNTCVEKKEFSGMHYFINHAAEFHFDSLRFTCVVCSRLFWNYVALANHYKTIHHSFTAVFCCHCGKLFHSITSGAIHYKKIMIMLTEDEKRLKKEGKLETEETAHICHVCGKACKNNYTLVKHIATHEEPDPSKMLQCHICSKLFNTKNKLAQHMVGHNNLRKWKCKICGMSFNFKKLLQMHTRAVHENERSFSCTFCEKKFFKKYDLTVHVRLHTGDFPYACPVNDCDAKYPAWSNLFKHCQSRHKLDIRSEGYKKLRASEKTSQNDEYGSE